MHIATPHHQNLIQIASITDFALPVSGFANSDAPWLNDPLNDDERSNVRRIAAFWDVWKEIPFRVEALGGFFATDVTVRTGWRGEHVITGRDEALGMYAGEIERQTEHGEITDFKFPVIIAKGPIVFHTWVWIAQSEKFGYHIERPMAALYLMRDGLIERWDSYCTGPESAPGYVGGDGPDGL